MPFRTRFFASLRMTGSKWCRGGDLNSYGLTPTTPSRWRVYLIPPPRHSPPTKSLILWVLNSGRGGRIRTRDLRFWRPLLFHLSYTPVLPEFQVSPGRFERPTRGLGIRGSQNLPDLKLKPPFWGPNDLQFFHHRGAKSRKL